MLRSFLCVLVLQVAKAILDLRQLYNYQQNCRSNGRLNADVHALIAATEAESHQLMESTLDRILALENWDRETLEMPEGLRLLRDKILTKM